MNPKPKAFAGLLRQHRGAVMWGGACFALGFIARHEIGWLWDHVLFYVVMGVVGLVVVFAYALFMGGVADEIATITPNSPEQVRLREMLLNQDPQSRN